MLYKSETEKNVFETKTIFVDLIDKTFLICVRLHQCYVSTRSSYINHILDIIVNSKTPNPYVYFFSRLLAVVKEARICRHFHGNSVREKLFPKVLRTYIGVVVVDRGDRDMHPVSI